MDKLLSICLLLAAVSGPVVAGESAQPIGYIVADVHVAAPITVDAGGNLAYHLTNVGPIPVLIEISEFSYQPLFVRVMPPGKNFNPNKHYDALGPPTGDMPFEPDAIMVSGAERMSSGRFPEWPKRDGIALLQGEGYARLIFFLPDWIKAKDVPNEMREWMVVNAAPSLRVALPKREPGAVSPGKPVVFDAMHRVWVPGDRLVPFKKKADRLPDPGPIPAPNDVDLCTLVQLPASVEAGVDLVATYLIGNEGTKSVWISQNQLVPAQATWEILKDDRVVATIDGSQLAAMVDLLPLRGPMPLNPGEYLTYKRALPAGALPFKKGASYQVRVQVGSKEIRLAADGPVQASEPMTGISPVFRVK